MYSRYRENKRNAITINTDPTMTDQSAEKDTDINIIVNHMIRTGEQGNAAVQPQQYADMTQFPKDLRGMIDMARSLKEHMKRLPPNLQNLGPEQLLALTPQQLHNILTPPEQPATPEDEKK